MKRRLLRTVTRVTVSPTLVKAQEVPEAPHSPWKAVTAVPETSKPQGTDRYLTREAHPVGLLGSRELETT